MVQEQQKLKERMEEIYKLHKEFEKFERERVKQEKNRIVETIQQKIKNSIDKINRYIERYVAWELEKGVTVYDITHEYDPPYDHSGCLVRTNSEMNQYSTERFHDFLKQYVGYSEASFFSGMGILYPDFEQEICEEIEVILQKIQYETLREMFDTRKIDLIILDEIDFGKEKIETEEDLDELFYNILDEINWELLDYFEDEIFYKLPIYVENEKLCVIYKKHEFEMKRLAKNLRNYKKAYTDFMEKLREEAMEIVVVPRFKRKIETNEKELVQELKMAYSKEQLGLLSYFNILRCSNKLKLEFEKVIEREIVEKKKELKKQYPFELKYE